MILCMQNFTKSICGERYMGRMARSQNCQANDYYSILGPLAGDPFQFA